MKVSRLRRTDDQGAVAILVAVLVVVLFAATALAVDMTSLLVTKQTLENTLDASSTAAASKLPDANAAFLAAQDYLTKNGITPASEANLAISTWCIVRSTGGANPGLDTTTIPSSDVCSIGAGPWAYQCNGSICAIPCPSPSSYQWTTASPPPAGTKCNAIKVTDRKTVPFTFAPMIGVKTGDTGAVTSAACRGSCGSVTTNPLNVAVIVDRTGSTAAYVDPVTKTTGVVDDEVAAIQTMMQQMATKTQYLAIGTLGKSLAPSTAGTWCSTVTPAATMTTASSQYFPGLTRTTPVAFTHDFLTSTGSIDTTKSIPQQLACLTNANHSGSGTQLAAPLKAASRAVLGLDGSTGRNAAGGVTNVVFILTDAQPNEDLNVSGSTNVTVAGDLASTTVSTACSNFSAVASSAKANGVLIVAIGFGDATKMDCSGSTGRATVLAGVASPAKGASGTGSVNEFDCATAAGKKSENTDGDYYFCADSGSDLATIFTTALAQASGQSKLILFP